MRQNSLKYTVMECAICLDPIECADRFDTTICRHVFHKRCMRTWHRYCPDRARCPLCRATVPDVALVRVVSLFVSMYVLFLAILYPINYFAMYHACQSFGRLNGQVVCYVRT